MNIKEQCVVTINYKVKSESGDIIEQSENDPFTYLHGTGGVIPGLEKALEGKTSGDKLTVKVEPEDGYGPIVPQLIQNMPKEAFQGVEKLEPGMEFQNTDEDHNLIVVRIEKVGEDEVTVNGNHPLAGKTLIFDVDIVDVREATDEELSHGHSHAEA